MKNGTEIKTKMLNICRERLSVNPEDPWALSTQSRIYECVDILLLLNHDTIKAIQ